MDYWDTTKRKIGKYAIITLVVMLASGVIAGWINSYIDFLGTAGSYVSKFIAIFILIWIFNYLTSAWLEVT